MEVRNQPYTPKLELEKKLNESIRVERAKSFSLIKIIVKSLPKETATISENNIRNRIQTLLYQ
jgi:hypothetical protein